MPYYRDPFHPIAALLLSVVCTPTVVGQTTLLPRPPEVLPFFECWEYPANLAGTPMAAFVPTEPWAYFSTFSSYPTTQTISLGLISGNFLSPGQQFYAGQPTTFPPGYDQARFPVRLGQYTSSVTTDLWATPPTWYLVGPSQTVARRASSPAKPAASTPYTENHFCPATLIPAMTVIPNTGTAAHQLLATLVAPAPAQATVTVEAIQGFNPPDRATSGTVSNTYYQNGSIYGDISPANPQPSPVSWFPIRVRSGNTVIAFGHVPVLAAASCASSISPGNVGSAQIALPYSQTFTSSNPAYILSLTGALPPGLAFDNGVLSGTPLVAGAFSFTVFAVAADGSCVQQTSYTIVVGGPACASDFTSQVAISFGGLKKNLTNGQFTETVTFQNTGSTTLSGPINVVITSLSANAALTNSQGVTQCFAPSGIPYVTYPGTLAPTASGTVTLSFTNSQPAQSITFTPRIAAGGNQL